MENTLAPTATNNLKKAILQLYSSCDVDSSNQVPLSNLLDSINSPEFGREFVEVKEQFYLNGETLGVSSEMFVWIVFEWVRSKGLVTSTSTSSETGSNLCCDTSMERVKELDHKNKQLNTELDYIRCELGHLDEQNNLLQAANDKLSNELLRCKNTISELWSKRGDTQELSTVIEEYEKIVHKLKKSLADAEKDNAKIKGCVLQTDLANDQLQEVVKARTKNEETKAQLIAELEIKLQEKEREVLEVLETSSKLQAQMEEQKQLVVHYTEQDRLQKEQVKQMETTIQDYRWRFSILNTTVFNAPNPQSPRPQILTEVFNFNSPRLLRNLANPVSPSLDPNTSIGLNDSDEISAQLLLSNCSNNNVSLYDEMVMADHEHRSLEYENLIAQQKSQIEELENALETSKNAEERLVSEIEALNLQIKTFAASVDSLKREQVELAQNLAEEMRKGDKKIGNFSKMEIKLEKREAQLEDLNRAINAERRISVRLKEENLNLVREKAILLEEKRLIESQLHTKFEIDYASLESSDTNTELDQLTNQIGNFDNLHQVRDDDDLLIKIVNAIEKDLKTVDSRCTSQRQCYFEHVEKILKEFQKLKLMIKKIQERMSNDDCLNQLDNVVQCSKISVEVAASYGRVLRERDDIKYLSILSKVAISKVKTVTKKRKFCKWAWVMFMSAVCIFIVYGILSYNRIFISFNDRKPSGFILSVT